MQATTKPAPSHPVLPAPLSFPFRALPSSVHSKTLAATLNNIFDDNIKEGELDFLQDRLIHITIDDAGIEYRLSFNGNRLVAGNEGCMADLSLNGTLYNYMLLASRREDTDTLFFSRRLQMQGDTELGLHVKNFLDGMDMDSHRVPAILESVIRKTLPWYERLFG